MPIARRSHRRPIDPSWLEVSPRSQLAASGASHAHFEHERFDQDDSDAEGELQGSAEQRALVARDRTFATLLGGLAGALGGAAMLVVARALMLQHASALDPAVALGERFPLHTSVAPAIAGIAMAVAIGTVTGAILGRSTWRVARVVPRIIFFAIIVPTLWLFAQVFLIGHMSRASVSAVPFVPFLVGSLAYAFLIAVIPAIHRARVTEILPAK